MILITRILIGAAGALFIALALGFWFNTAGAAANVGLIELDLNGKATVRADMAGYFIVGGGIAFYAAIRQNAAYLWPALLLLIAAFVGRTLTLIVDGSSPQSFAPMIIEAVMIALIIYAQRNWNRKTQI